MVMRFRTVREGWDGVGGGTWCCVSFSTDGGMTVLKATTRTLNCARVCSAD